MKVETYICDFCQTQKASRIFREAIGREMDPSGNGYNTDYKYYDVCEQCYGKFSKNFPNARIVRCV